MDLEKLRKLLTPKTRAFLKSLYLDTRIKQPLNVQILREPKEVKEAVELIKNNKEEFPLAVRFLRSDTYNTFIKIQNTNDDLERLALWADYLDLRMD